MSSASLPWFICPRYRETLARLVALTSRPSRRRKR